VHGRVEANFRRLPVSVAVDAELDGAELDTLRARLAVLDAVVARVEVFDDGALVECLAGLEGSADRGDYKPLVFIALAHEPAGDWQGAAARVHLLAELRFVNVFAFAFDPDARRAAAALTPGAFFGPRSALADALQWSGAVVERTARLAGKAAAKHKLIAPPSPPTSLQPLYA
jgi:hypothetical protein